MRKTETQHNTPEQVHAYLGAALAILDELELTDDLRPLAFVKAVDLLAAKQLFFEQPAALPMGAMHIPRGNGH